jgi:GNAT superfamily N-acetyltransferase
MKRAVFGAWRLAAGLARPSTAANLRRLRDRGESADGLKIRDATALDVSAIAKLHVATWDATYAPFFMKGPGCPIRERQWRAVFDAPPPGWFTLVVERADGELVGFAQGQLSDHPEFRGELRKIYLLRDYQRLGLGRRLIGRVARRFRSQGINSMWLFGDARNPSSRAWTSLGAVKTDDDPGNGNYGWRDLGALADIPD